MSSNGWCDVTRPPIRLLSYGQVNSESRLYSRSCNDEEMSNCELGDMVSKHGTLLLAALRDKLNE